MTFKQLKKRFEDLGYDLEHNNGHVYTLRNFGSANFDYEEKGRSAIESRLDRLEQEREFINSL